MLLVAALTPLRTAAALVLRKAGYEVDEAWEEAAAMASLAQRLSEYVALIVGIDGADRDKDVGARVLFKARADHPDLPVVAWSEPPRPTAATRRFVWLRRPWLPSELLDALRQLGLR